VIEITVPGAADFLGLVLAAVIHPTQDVGVCVERRPLDGLNEKGRGCIKSDAAKPVSRLREACDGRPRALADGSPDFIHAIDRVVFVRREELERCAGGREKSTADVEETCAGPQRANINP